MEESFHICALLSLARSDDTVLDEMGRLARALPHPPVSLIVFGSFARREAETDSDVDVVVVRPAHIDEDHEQWSTSLEAWRSDVRRIAGNPVEVLEVGVPDVARKLASRSQVWIDIRREGRVVHGLTIDELGAELLGEGPVRPARCPPMPLRRQPFLTIR